jgi:import inner membrane translocase subunit TIM22
VPKHRLLKSDNFNIFKDMQRAPPTREEALMMAAMESCPAKTVISGVAGFALGGVFGLVISSLDASASVPDPTKPEPSTREQVRNVFKDMGKRSFSTAKNFAVVAAIYSGVECTIEGYRAKNDLYNSMSAGCVTGSILAARCTS